MRVVGGRMLEEVGAFFLSLNLFVFTTAAGRCAPGHSTVEKAPHPSSAVV
jgi:hypothetical protein